jgi:hypothetical protein
MEEKKIVLFCFDFVFVFRRLFVSLSCSSLFLLFSHFTSRFDALFYPPSSL